MKKNIRAYTGIFLAVLLAAIVLMPGCIIGQVTGSGNVISRNYNLDGFTRLLLRSGFTVTVEASDTFNIEVKADDNLFSHMNVVKNGDTVTIGLKSGSYTQTNLSAVVRMPVLNGIETRDGCQVDVKGFNSANNLSLTLHDGTEISGKLTAGDVEISLGDGSGVTLEGAAGSLKMNSHDGSRANLDDFPVGNADLTIGDGGTATVSVSGTLNVDLSAGSSVYYTGNPAMGKVNLSSGSSLKKKG